MCLDWSCGKVRAAPPLGVVLALTVTHRDRADADFAPLTALDFSGCRLPNCTTLHHDVTIPEWLSLATIAQRTLLLHLPLRTLVHRSLKRMPGPTVLPAGDWIPNEFGTTYSEPGYHPFAQPWLYLTTLRLDVAPELEWLEGEDGYPLTHLLPAANWRFEVLILETDGSGCNAYGLFFPWWGERVRDDGWLCVRRIELWGSAEYEQDFRAYVTEQKAKWGINTLQLRLLSLVVFLESDGGGPDQRLVQDGSLP